MALFAVNVSETLSHSYIVEAETFEDAVETISAAKAVGDIILECDDISESTVGATVTFGEKEIPPTDERINYFTKYKN